MQNEAVPHDGQEEVALVPNSEKPLLLTTAAEEEWPGLRRAIVEVKATSTQMVDHGLSQTAFFLGVVNLAVTGFVLGRFPEYVWVLYAIKCVIYIPTWFVEVTRRFAGSLWVLDFCWVANIFMAAYMLTNFFYGPYIPIPVRRFCYLWFYATAMGPLSWAALALGNGLIFHSIERTASLFIHFTPSLVAWTLRWSPKLMEEKWPDYFTEETLAKADLKDLYIAGISMYGIWVVLHALWLLTCGVDAPKKGYSTIFQGLYEKNGLADKMTKATGITSIRGHAALYLAVHAFLCSLCFAWSLLCYKYWLVHTIFMLIAFIVIVWVGSGYYMYLFTGVYVKALNKLVPASEDETKV